MYADRENNGGAGDREVRRKVLKEVRGGVPGPQGDTGCRVGWQSWGGRWLGAGRLGDR